MESYKQFIQVAVAQFTFFFQSKFLNLFKINLIKRFLVVSSEAGMISFMMLIACPSSAAPPEQVNPGSASYVAPANARLSKNHTREEWAKGRILVMPRAGLPARAFADILKEHGGRARKIGQSDLYIVELPEYSEEGTVVKLRNHPHLKFAELDYIIQSVLVPNDPYYNYYGDALHLPQIGAPIAWDITQGAGVTIAILDSGVDGAHPDLSANIVPGWNFYDINSDTNDVYGHGTRVAGAAGAITNNNMGVAAVAGQSKIMPLRVSDVNGYGYVSMIAEGLIYAADHGARVANASFVGLTNYPTIINAAQYMKSKNGLVIIGAGNTASQENFTVTTAMIPVSATDTNDVKAGFSSYGDFVVLSAPGDGIWTTYRNNSYWAATGTSMASPVVAGVVALMMSANTKLSSAEIENLLFSTAVDLGVAGRDPYYGFGRVDAAKAVQAAKVATSIQDTEVPVISITDPLEGAVVSGVVPVDIDVTDNVEVVRAELWVNDTSVAVDTASPFAFAWDSTGTQNGIAKLMVHVYDLANNMASSGIEVTVDNPTQSSIADTQSPVIQIINPVAGNVSGNVTISVNASDNSGATGISLWIYIDGSLKASGFGSTMSINWNTRKNVKIGAHTIQVVAKDVAGNTSKASVNVNVVK
jgi:thermitase